MLKAELISYLMLLFVATAALLITTYDFSLFWALASAAALVSALIGGAALLSILLSIRFNRRREKIANALLTRICEHQISCTLNFDTGKNYYPEFKIDGSQDLHALSRFGKSPTLNDFPKSLQGIVKRHIHFLREEVDFDEPLSVAEQVINMRLLPRLYSAAKQKKLAFVNIIGEPSQGQLLS